MVAGGTKLKIIRGGTAHDNSFQAGSVGYNAAPSKTFNINVTEYSPYPDSITGMTIWLDANDVNGDGLSESASDFTTVGSKTQVSRLGRPLGNNNLVSICKPPPTGVQPVWW